MGAKSSSSRLGTWTKALAKVTAVIAATGALLNAAVDVYRSVANIPRSAQERTHEALFKAHFGELPLLSQQVDIKHDQMVVGMVIEVYDGADILVRYGGTPQWFKAPLPKSARTSWLPSILELASVPLALLGTANAQVPVGPETKGQQAVIRPSITIDLDAVKNNQNAQVDSTGAVQTGTAHTLEKAYLVAATKNDHDGLKAKSKTYTQVFRSEPGYSIESFTFQLSSGNNSRIVSIKAAPNKQSITVVYEMTSGPIFDRWRGWIKGTLQTTQIKEAK